MPDDPALTDAQLHQIDGTDEVSWERAVANAQLRKALWWAAGNYLLSGGLGPLYGCGWNAAIGALKKRLEEMGIEPWPEEE